MFLKKAIIKLQLKDDIIQRKVIQMHVNCKEANFVLNQILCLMIC